MTRGRVKYYAKNSIQINPTNLQFYFVRFVCREPSPSGRPVSKYAERKCTAIRSTSKQYQYPHLRLSRQYTSHSATNSTIPPFTHGSTRGPFRKSNVELGANEFAATNDAIATNIATTTRPNSRTTAHD